jgi:tRNA(Arg) A34 adenosine deaminase TadA
MTEERTIELIKECQSEAQKAIDSGNPPFGCVITDAEGNIVARAFNTQNSDTDPVAHAETKALTQLGKKLRSRYLDGYVIFANASSCSMCMSGAIKAHITRFYFGAPPEPSMDPWLPMEEVASKAKNPIEVHGPILGDECAAQIADGRTSVTAKS